MRIRFNNFLYLLPIFIISIYYSIHHFEPQSAVDGGLILSNKIIFPDNFKNVSTIFFNSWTILHHFTYLLFKINLSVDSVSIILIFITTISYTLGIYFLSLGFTDSKIFSLFLALLTIVTRENFGWLDYPVFYFAEHTYGIFSLSIFTLVSGFLCNKQYKFAGFFSIILLGGHLVVGLWVLLIFLISFLLFFFLKIYKNYDFKKIFVGILFGLIPIVISLVFFKFHTIDHTSYNTNDFSIYMSIWDHHRNISTINYNYILKTLLLLVVLTIFLFNFRSNKNLIFYLFILFSCLGSMIIYLSLKLFPEYLPNLLVRAMPTRLFLSHSVIGYPIMICCGYLFLKKISFFNNQRFQVKSKYIYFLSILIFSILLTLNFNEINSRALKIKTTLNSIYKSDEKIFWERVNNLKTNGFFITTYFSSNPTLRYGRKPYLINAKYFDHIPYHPYTSSETKLIIENIYGVDYEDPPQKYLAAIPDEWFKDTFESRTIYEWKNLSKIHNISGIIVPSNWKININQKIKSKNFTVYIFD